MNKKRIQFVLFVVLAMMVALPSAGSAQAANSPKANLQFSGPLVVGTTTLKAGDYKVQCKTIDGKEYIVVTSADNGAEVARVPCVAEVLSERLKSSDFSTANRADGTQALTVVRIKGESVAHRVVTP